MIEHKEGNFFQGGKITLHQVGDFFIWEYINPHNIPLIYITAKNKQTLERYSLGIESSFVQEGETYYHIGTPKMFTKWAGCDYSIGMMGMCFHDIKTSIRFCSFLLLQDL